jgi:hypothetical protein
MPPKPERIEFWKYAYARSAFLEARTHLEELLTHRPGRFTSARKLYTIAILTLYARPFKQREPVRLAEDIVEEKYRPVHNWVIEHRDKVVAHRDLDAQLSTSGFVNQLRLVTNGYKFQVYTLSPFISDDKARDILALVNALIQIADEKTDPFINEHVRLAPMPPGQYVINLKDDFPPHWIQPAEKNVYLPDW